MVKILYKSEKRRETSRDTFTHSLHIKPAEEVSESGKESSTNKQDGHSSPHTDVNQNTSKLHGRRLSLQGERPELYRAAESVVNNTDEPLQRLNIESPTSKKQSSSKTQSHSSLTENP